MKETDRGIIFALAGTALMSLDAVFVRLSGLSGWNSSLLFGFFSFVSMSLFTSVRGGGVIRAVRGGGMMIFISGMVMGGSGNSFVLAVKATTVANVILIMTATPIFSALFSRIFLGERTDGRTWTAIVMCVAGIYIIVSGSLKSGGFKGDMLAVLASFFVSANYVIWRKYKNISRSMVVGLGGFFIALFSLPQSHIGGITAHGALVMAIMGLLSAPFGRTFMSSAARYITAPQLGLYSLLKSVITPAIIWLIYREVPDVRTFIGGTVILFAVFWHIWRTGTKTSK